MRSYPLIAPALSDTQLQFDCFVERHAIRCGALYETDGDGRLPGDTVKMTVTSRTSVDDVAERRHTVEFMALDGEGHWAQVGCIGHSVKEIDALQGRSHQIESTFVIKGLGIPEGRYRTADVEPFVRAQLDELEAARLLPMRSRITGERSEACAA
jgi:hypothetical protein